MKSFYIKSASSFPKGVKAKPGFEASKGKEAKEAMEAKQPVDAFKVSGPGEAVGES